MTRRLLAFLGAIFLLFGVAATAPAPLAGAALMPRAMPAVAAPVFFDVHIGDGIFQLRIRGCETCDTAVTVVIDLPPVFPDVARSRS